MNPETTESPERKRHPFVTFWLVFVIANGISSIFAYTVFKKDVEQLFGIELTSNITYMLVGMGVWNAISGLLLFSWKKIGFHGLVISGIFGMYVNYLMGAGAESTLLGLIQLGILYMILQLKKDGKSTWQWLT